MLLRWTVTEAFSSCFGLASGDFSSPCRFHRTSAKVETTGVRGTGSRRWLGASAMSSRHTAAFHRIGPEVKRTGPWAPWMAPKNVWWMVRQKKASNLGIVPSTLHPLYILYISKERTALGVLWRCLGKDMASSRSEHFHVRVEAFSK